MAMATEDPFACFGNSDDDDSNNDSGSDAINQHQQTKSPPEEDDGDAASASANMDRARHLMEAYNANKKHSYSPQTTTSIKSSPNADSTKPFHSSYQDQKSRTSSLPWPQSPPLYLGPMSLSSALLSEGGGRGYIATQDLSPGTCVLIEEPFVKGWSDQQMGKRLGLESIQHLFDMEDAKKIVRCMEELHPRKDKVEEIVFQEEDDNRTTNSSTTGVDPMDKVQIVDMISNDASHNDDQQVKALVSYAKVRDITNSDGSVLNERDIHRLLLTMRYNGFDSGLYLHFSMFNHNEDPNCIKFRPTGEKTSSVQGAGGYYSEARTTRYVRKGEALTLHYLENPREVSHATRRKILWDQHRFDIGDEYEYKRFLDTTLNQTGHLFNDNERGNHVYESELVNGNFPLSTREGPEASVDGGEEASDGDNLPATTFNIENSLDDLEDMLVELQAIFKLQDQAKDKDGRTTTTATADDDGDENNHFDRAAALELTIGELITASRSTLGNPFHILLSRCHRLHLDSIELLLSHCGSTLTGKQSIELMATKFVPSVHALLESQRRILGNDHPDVARSYNDLSMGLQALLSHSPKRLVSLKMEGMRTLEECSRMEYYFRAEKKRIDEMYPRDVDDILNSVRERK